MHYSPSFSWLMNHLSYRAILLVAFVLLIGSLFPITYFWVITHLMQLREIEQDRKEIAQERLLGTLLTQLQHHRLVSQLNTSPNLIKEIEQTQHAIDRTLHEVKETFHAISSTDDLTDWQKIDVDEIDRVWQVLTVNRPSLTPTEQAAHHTALIQQLIVQVSYLNDKVGMSYFKVLRHYPAMEAIALRLPLLQERLSQLLLLPFLSHESHGNALYRSLLTSQIQWDLDDFQRRLEKTRSAEEKSPLRDALVHYLAAANHLLHFLEQSPSPLSSTQQETLARTWQEVVDASGTLWEAERQGLSALLQQEQRIVSHELWGILLLTFVIVALAFWLGYTLVILITRRISQLTEATERFAAGALDTRLPLTYRDEMGRQAAAFNHMAQRMEQLIRQLYGLASATTALARGELHTRLAVEQGGEEFSSVAQAFNHMAETLQQLLRHLQHTACTLRDSAAAITTAVEEHTQIIVAQESSSTAISHATIQIASTSRALMETMHEANRVVGQTAHLATTGQRSLSGMEATWMHLQERLQAMATTFSFLQEKMTYIAPIVSTIAKVADQTNLLSLNAAIEAEKGGQYGKGFGVIAREIRRLADQTALATQDIEQKVEDMTQAISFNTKGMEGFSRDIQRGIEALKDAGSQLSSLIDQVQTLPPQFDKITHGMEGQVHDVEGIKEAIATLSQTARHIAETVRTSRVTIQTLNRAAEELQILNPFKT